MQDRSSRRLNGALTRVNLIVLGVSLIVLGGVTGVLPSASAQSPADLGAVMPNSVSIPPRCIITTTMKAIDATDFAGPAVVGAVIAVCTRGTTRSLTLQLGAPRLDCEGVPLDGGRATACGGPAAAAFIRTLGLNPAREFKVYASVFDTAPAESSADAAAVAIEF
jgi:hypothetical protein